MRNRKSGVVLFNVLVMTALMALVVMSMLSIESAALSRSLAFSEASQALTLSRAAEASVADALVDDAMTSAEADYLGEAWSQISQRRIAITIGFFELEVSDAQARVNLRRYIDAAEQGEDISQQPQLTTLLARAGVSESEIDVFLGALSSADPKDKLDIILQGSGLEHHLATLERYFVVLPKETLVNANTASPEVLEAILGNPAQARLVQSLKRRNGFVREADLSALGFEAVQGLTVSSEFFEVVSFVEIGSTPQRVKSLIYRPLKTDDSYGPRVIQRTRLEPIKTTARN